MYRLILALAVVVAAVAGFAQRTSAQALTFTLFERYLESLRDQAGIPGLSALISQGGTEVWSTGFGRADIEANLRPTPDTPYLIGDLSQSIGATMLLKECIDESYAELDDPVAEWIAFPESNTQLAHLLAHISPSGAFKYDLGRFALLTAVVEACSDNPYSPLLHDEVFKRFGMKNSVPGTAIVTPTALERRQYDGVDLQHFAYVLSQMATPYHVDRGRHVRTELGRVQANAANGIVTTVRDFATFDAMLDINDDRGLIEPKTLERAWGTLGSNLPAGLGWFLQTYNREPIVWQFGVVTNAYSALVVKVPNRRLTFILFANSDALAAPFMRETWDVTASAFAKLFLVTFVP